MISLFPSVYLPNTLSSWDVPLGKEIFPGSIVIDSKTAGETRTVEVVVTPPLVAVIL